MASDLLLIVLVVIIVLSLFLIIHLAPQSGLSSRRRSRRFTLKDGIANLDFTGIRRKLAHNAKY